MANSRNYERNEKIQLKVETGKTIWCNLLLFFFLTEKMKDWCRGLNDEIAGCERVYIQAVTDYTKARGGGTNSAALHIALPYR